MENFDKTEDTGSEVDTEEGSDSDVEDSEDVADTAEEDREEESEKEADEKKAFFSAGIAAALSGEAWEIETSLPEEAVPKSRAP